MPVWCRVSIPLAFLSPVILGAFHGQTNVAGNEPLFANNNDIGTVLHAGSVAFDGANSSYTITASGENIWGTADAFHFIWRKYSGDVSVTADIAFLTKTGNPHKKAVLMIRQSLDADSPYVDVALHASGLTSLQSRQEKGGATHEIGIDDEAATKLRLEKRGPYFYMYVARAGEELHFAGGSMRLELDEPFYIGLGVCAHDKDAMETAVFSNVALAAPAKGQARLRSTIETISVSSTDRRVVAVIDGRAGAPSWTAAGTALTFSSLKKMMQVPATGGKIVEIVNEPVKKAKRGMKASPDGQREVGVSYEGKKPAETILSMRTVSDGKVKILARLEGGEGTLSDEPWSPDGKRLAFVSYQTLP